MASLITCFVVLLLCVLSQAFRLNVRKSIQVSFRLSNKMASKLSVDQTVLLKPAKGFDSVNKSKQEDKLKRGQAPVSLGTSSSEEKAVIEKFMMMYTCKICLFKNTNMVSKVAYHKGMVISTCKDCRSMHLIADNERKLDMGKAESYNRIGDFLASKGESVQQLRVPLDKLGSHYLVEKDGEITLVPKSAGKAAVDGRIVEIPQVQGSSESETGTETEAEAEPTPASTSTSSSTHAPSTVG